MTLHSEYTYLFLDFETTGLDLASDFPIQIGLVQTDHHLSITKSYKSFITLPESIKKLRSNVSYMTGIDIETIESQWQSLETIQSQIADFFSPETILIWQNISFDIWFLRKFFPWCMFAYQIDTYPLAASSIPYLKSYSLESIDHHLTEKYTSYTDKKLYLLNTLSKEERISAHDALYDCISWICFIWRWYEQINNFEKEFPIIKEILSKTEGEWIRLFLSSWAEWNGVERSFINKNKGSLHKVGMTNQYWLPILTSPLISEKKYSHEDTIDRSKQDQHSKRSTRWVDLETLIKELPHPCIIAVSHGSKIDIIKRACNNEQFDYLKEEQILDQEKLSQWLQKDTYTEDEFLFVCFYLAHHRDGYRILTPTLSTHKYILDYLQIKKIELKKDKKILCSHGGLYYTIQNNPDRKDIYKDYPICILDSDRWHSTYNDYAQKWIWITSILYQREKYKYETQQNPLCHLEQSETESKDLLSTTIKDPSTRSGWQTIEKIKTIINNLTFFIAHFTKDSEKQYNNLRQYKREIDYLLNHQSYINTAESRNNIRDLRNDLLQKKSNIPQYLIDSMNKLSILFQHPLKIQRNTNQNKDIRYSIAPAVRYIDFSEYLKMFGEHKVLFFSSDRSEYKKFLPEKESLKIPIIKESDIERIITYITNHNEKSYFIISHQTEKSKKIFNLLHEQKHDEKYNLIGEYITWGVNKSSLRKDNNKKNIYIGGYHMLLHLRWEGIIIDTIFITYVSSNIYNFIENDIQQYALKS